MRFAMTHNADSLTVEQKPFQNKSFTHIPKTLLDDFRKACGRNKLTEHEGIIYAMTMFVIETKQSDKSVYVFSPGQKAGRKRRPGGGRHKKELTEEQVHERTEREMKRALKAKVKVEKIKAGKVKKKAKVKVKKIKIPREKPQSKVVVLVENEEDLLDALADAQADTALLSKDTPEESINRHRGFFEKIAEEIKGEGKA